MSRINMVGLKFGRLTVLVFSHKIKEQLYWVCNCTCGRVAVVNGSHMRSGNTKSCGCLHKDASKRVCFQTTHNESNSRLHSIWRGIKKRCLNPNAGNYSDYGGRGITVCAEWVNSYEKFRDDMGHPPFVGASIDRIDNEKGYSKENCRWATVIEQRHNVRSNINLTYEGETHCLAEWARIKKMNEQTLYCRIRKGWDVADALTRDIRITCRSRPYVE
jgi:hypothetical protein